MIFIENMAFYVFFYRKRGPFRVLYKKALSESFVEKGPLYGFYRKKDLFRIFMVKRAFLAFLGKKAF